MPQQVSVTPLKTVLPNGLKILLLENPTTPVVAFQAWIAVGSVHEAPDEAGIAHVIEHMLFKGTGRRGVGEIAREVESAGGEINAWTSFDETVYHVVLASRFFDTGLDIVADALMNPSFDARELEREIRVILEEIRQGEDRPARVTAETLFATAYLRHPYRRPVIGSMRTVQAITREKVVAFHRRHYVASNTTLVVVGAFDAKRALAKIEAAFAGMPKGKATVTAANEPQQKAPRVSVVARDVHEARLSLAFHIPGVRHEDTAALGVLAAIVGQGESSRLNTEVRRNKQLVTDVQAYAYTPRDRGLFIVGATMLPDQFKAATRAILDELYNVSFGEVSEEEVERARVNIEAENVYTRETAQGLARKIGFFEVVAGDWAYEDVYVRAVRGVTPSRVREVAAKYLRPENLSVVALVPQAPASGEASERRSAPSKTKGAARSESALEHVRKFLLSEVEARATLAQDRWRKASRADGHADDVVVDVLPSGARLIVKRDPSVALVAFRAVWVGGLRYEDARSNGVSTLLAMLLTRGTKTRTAEQLAREVEAMAGSIGGFTGRNSMGIRGEFLSRHWEHGLEVLADCILNPAFSEEEVEKERRLVLAEIQAQEDNLTSVAFQLFSETFYKKHPYRMNLLGTTESVSGLSQRRIREFYSRCMAPGRMTLAVVGDVDPERVRAKVRALFAGVSDDASRPEPAVPTEPPRPDSGPEQAFKFLNRHQAHVVVGFPGTTVKHPDRFALEVLATVLSGQGGRLFLELRDRRGLAYQVNAFSLEGIDPGYFAVYLATSPQNLEAALAGIKAEVERIKQEPVPRDELERAKRYIVGTHEISLQRRSALASVMAFHEAYGLGWAEYRKYPDSILKVTAKDVQRVARQYLDLRRAVIAVVKPEEVTPGLDKKREHSQGTSSRNRGAHGRGTSGGGHRS